MSNGRIIREQQRLMNNRRTSRMICKKNDMIINPLNAELNPICYLLTLLGAHHILHVSRIRVNK